ncbi:hypothetical protein M0R45_007822 [Rubus argutus]|uniref:Uncharacterized protein n=1 Tax=Rubus argutus TaxID=59490 RepID=A0AAW1Y2C9_RUBAR
MVTHSQRSKYKAKGQRSKVHQPEKEVQAWKATWPAWHPNPACSAKSDQKELSWVRQQAYVAELCTTSGNGSSASSSQQIKWVFGRKIDTSVQKKWSKE